MMSFGATFMNPAGFDVAGVRAAGDVVLVERPTTAMELTANPRPFIHFPLGHHFEQNFQVRHRLERFGARRCMDIDNARADT
jgi:hypothetical protein